MSLTAITIPHARLAEVEQLGVFPHDAIVRAFTRLGPEAEASAVVELLFESGAARPEEPPAGAAAAAPPPQAAAPPTWDCPKCTFVNVEGVGTCEMCGLAAPVVLPAPPVIPAPSVPAAPAPMPAAPVLPGPGDDNRPLNWEPMPRGCGYKEFELTHRRDAEEELSFVVRSLREGGLKFRRIVSVRRIQNDPLWRGYAAMRDIVSAKSTNRGRANEKWLWHGARGNTDKICAEGFASARANSCPYGVWLSADANYSGTSFADTRPDGSREMFLTLATIGTPGVDDGSGRRPRPVPGSSNVLADAHVQGFVHVLYQDRQVYPFYVVRWIPAPGGRRPGRPGRPGRGPRPGRGRCGRRPPAAAMPFMPVMTDMVDDAEEWEERRELG